LWIKVLLLGVLSVSSANAERSLKVQDMQNEARVALVIGNGKYDEQPLKNPTNDSKAMKEILLKKGFEVIYKENATQEEMESSIDKFLNTLKSKKAVGLLYYAGHGIEAKGENYLIPIGAKISSENFIKQKTIALNSIIEGMQDSKNELNIIILDACRDNPYRGIVRSGKRGLTGINNANGIFIAYATAVGDVAADGSGKNGLFTSSLLKYIDEEGLKLEDVFKAVHHDVKKQSSGIQQPWMNSAIYGDFYFTLPKVQNTQVATQSVSQVQKIEQVVKPVIEEKPQIITNRSIIHHKLPTIQGEMIEIEEDGEKLNFLQYSNKIVILEVFGKESMFCTKQGRILNMLKNSSKDKIQLIGLQVEGRMNPKETKKF
jgi:hypothetical protein